MAPTSTSLSCTATSAFVLPAPMPFPQFECRDDCAEYKAACVDFGLPGGSAQHRTAADSRGGGSICSEIVSGAPFYLPADTSFAYLEGTVQQLSFLFNFIPGGAAGEKCYRAFLRQMCTNVFLGCDDTVLPKLGVPAPLPFPKFGCRSDCIDYTQSCAFPESIMSALPPAARNFLSPNCTSAGAKFPASSTCGVVSGVGPRRLPGRLDDLRGGALPQQHQHGDRVRVGSDHMRHRCASQHVHEA
jgi:hypothetical protein